MNEQNTNYLLSHAGSDGASVTDADFLAPDEFARRAGISMSTLWRRVRTGVIPSIQPGGPRCRVLIPADALNADAWESRHELRCSKPQARDRVVTPAAKRTNSSRLSGPTPRWRKPR